MRTIWTAAVLASAAMTTSTMAADNAMQQCGTRYQAAKTGKTLPVGQTWPQFLATCRASLAKAPVAPVSAPGKAMAAAAPAKPAAGQPSAAQAAARQRQKQCAASYQADKSAGKLGGKSWPQYYSGCSAKLKG